MLGWVKPKLLGPAHLIIGPEKSDQCTARELKNKPEIQHNMGWAQVGLLLAQPLTLLMTVAVTVTMSIILLLVINQAWFSFYIYGFNLKTPNILIKII